MNLDPHVGELDKYVGQSLIVLKIDMGGCPVIQSVLPPDTNLEEVAERVERRILEVFEDELGPNIDWFRKLRIKLSPRSGIIKSKEERQKQFEKAGEVIGEIFGTDYDAVELIKTGWWKVSGTNHFCFVYADSDKDAREKAVQSGRIEGEIVSVEFESKKQSTNRD